MQRRRVCNSAVATVLCFVWCSAPSPCLVCFLTESWFFAPPIAGRMAIRRTCLPTRSTPCRCRSTTSSSDRARARKRPSERGDFAAANRFESSVSKACVAAQLSTFVILCRLGHLRARMTARDGATRRKMGVCWSRRSCELAKCVAHSLNKRRSRDQPRLDAVRSPQVGHL